MKSSNSDAGRHLPQPSTGKAAPPPARQAGHVEDEDQDPVGEATRAGRPLRRLSEGDKPVGESGNDGSSPYEEPNHPAQAQRDRS